VSQQNIQPEGWAAPKGYANGVLSVDGTLQVAGQVGWNSQQKFECDDFLGQMEQTLNNILAVVRTAGGDAADITRLTWYVTDKDEYMSNQQQVGQVYRSVLGRNFPAMSLVVVAGLIEDGALLEIEATAKISMD